jgi:hypothetical protein
MARLCLPCDAGWRSTTATGHIPWYFAESDMRMPSQHVMVCGMRVREEPAWRLRLVTAQTPSSLTRLCRVLGPLSARESGRLSSAFMTRPPPQHLLIS